MLRCGSAQRATATARQREQLLMTEPNLEGGCRCGAVRRTILGLNLTANDADSQRPGRHRRSGRPAALPHYRQATDGRDLPLRGVPPRQRQPHRRLGHVSGSAGQVPERQPDHLRVLPEGKWAFCSACGTQICFTADYIPGLIDITIGSSIAPPRSRRRCVIGTPKACPVFALPIEQLTTEQTLKLPDGSATRAPISPGIAWCTAAPIRCSRQYRCPRRARAHRSRSGCSCLRPTSIYPFCGGSLPAPCRHY